MMESLLTDMSPLSGKSVTTGFFGRQISDKQLLLEINSVGFLEPHRTKISFCKSSV